MAIAFALLVAGVCASGHASADPGASAFPGMEIHQGETVCTLGFVEPRLRIGITSGQCDGGDIVTDDHQNLLGTVVVARYNSAATDGSGVEYEVIGLGADVAASDVLPNGRRLQSAPGTHAQPAERLCHLGISTGQACGRVDSVGKGWFVVTEVAADGHDFGGPVYALSGENGAVMVGLFEGAGGSEARVESWQAVMRQLYIDAPIPGHSPASTARVTTR